MHLSNEADKKGTSLFFSTTQRCITILVFNIQLTGLFNQDEPSLFRLLRKDRKECNLFLQGGRRYTVSACSKRGTVTFGEMGQESQ